VRPFALLLAGLGRVGAANAYLTLGVPPDASEQTIRAAYRRSALASHPDKLAKGASAARREAAVTRMELVNEAYASVGDPDARRAYDRGQLSHDAAGRDGRAYHGSYRPPPVEVRASFACTLEQMGGFAAATVDLASVLGPRYASLRGLPPLRQWLPPGCAPGDVVRVSLERMGIELLLELRLAEPADSRGVDWRPRFVRHGADLDTTLWLPAWHNAWRRAARVRSIDGRRVLAVPRGKLVTSGEVVTLSGLGMPVCRPGGGAGASPYTNERGALVVELRLRSLSDSLLLAAGPVAGVVASAAVLRWIAPWRLLRRRKRSLVVRLWTGPNPLNYGRPFRLLGSKSWHTYQWVYD